jgi:hypothetical protein
MKILESLLDMRMAVPGELAIYPGIEADDFAHLQAAKQKYFAISTEIPNVKIRI